jgi:hypothetical protein
MDVLSDFQVNSLNPSVVNGNTTNWQYFTRPQASLLPGTVLSAASLPIFFGIPSAATPSAANATGQLAVPGRNKLNAQVFNVIAAGEVVSGSGAPSEVVEIAMYAQTGAQVATPAYTKIATTGQVQLNPTADGVYQLWSFNVTLLGSNHSGLVQGYQTVVFGGVVEKSNVATVGLSGISFDANTGGIPSSSMGGAGTAVAPPFGLVMGVQFGSANAGNIANLFQFQLGQS